MEKNDGLFKVLKFSFYVIFIIVVILGIICSVGFVMLDIPQKSNHQSLTTKKRKTTTYPYRSVLFNPTSKKVSYGIISLPKKLEGKKLLSFKNEENGNYLLVRNFNSKSYQCTGTCYCDVSKRRSATTTSKTINKGILFLVGAISSSIALKHAKTHFEDECNTIFSDGECEQGSITSEVEVCSELEAEVEKEGEISKNPEIDESMSARENLYLCSGHCISQKYGDKNDKEKEKVIKDYGDRCHVSVLEVMISSREFVTPCSRNEMIVDQGHHAVVEFLTNHLNDHFCWSGNQMLWEDNTVLDLCMAPQLYGKDLTNEIVKAEVKCMSLEELGSLNCEHE